MADNTIGSLLFASGFAPDALKSLQSAADNLAKQVKLNISVMVVTGNSTQAIAAIKPVVDSVSESTKKLANETATLRNQFIAGDKSAADVRTRLEQLKVSANAAAVGLDLTTKEARALTLASATASRTLAGLEGDASKLGLASQVTTGILGSLKGALTTIGVGLGVAGFGVIARGFEDVSLQAAKASATLQIYQGQLSVLLLRFGSAATACGSSFPSVGSAIPRLDARLSNRICQPAPLLPCSTRVNADAQHP